MTFVASAGDTGSPGGYPAYSPNVLSVGGTTLNLSTGNYSSETVWDNSSSSATGGGISKYEAEPAYQDGVVPSSADSNNGAQPAPCPTWRSTPIRTRAWRSSIRSTTAAAPGWVQVGGTSFGTPAWAAIIAIADQGRAIDGLGSLDGSLANAARNLCDAEHRFSRTSPAARTAPIPRPGGLRPGHRPRNADRFVGRWLFGRHSRHVRLRRPLARYHGATASNDPTSFTVTFSDAYSTSGLVASDFEVNGVAATSFTDTSSTSITFTFSTSPILTESVDADDDDRGRSDRARQRRQRR